MSAGKYDLSFLQADFASYYPGLNGVGAIQVDIEKPNVVAYNNTFQVPALADFTKQDATFTVTDPGVYNFNLISVYQHAGIVDNFDLHPTPEPTTLLALGAGVLAMLRRRNSSR